MTADPTPLPPRSHPAMQPQPVQNESKTAIKVRLCLTHLIALSVVLGPFNGALLTLCLVSYFVRMVGVEVGYHRYFSHRAFETSRAFQCLLGVLAVSSGERGLLTWASLHRRHHQHSDTDRDPHSPVVGSFWHAHVAWIWDDRNRNPSYDNVRDLTRFPELVWLNRYHFVVTLTLMLGMFALGHFTAWFGPGVTGWDTLVWGFFLPTLAIVHMTMAVNSVLHLPWLGYRRFGTQDGSRNSWWLAIPSLGVSFHNNHHRFAAAARGGFYWWELDLGYALLRVLAAFGLVWNLREVPARILDEGRLRPRDAARERVPTGP